MSPSPSLSALGGAVGRAVARALFRRREDGWAFTLLFASLFAAVQVVGHGLHEPWRDELHGWGVGRNADGLWDLLTGERRYDGHPFLWYYLLHLVSRLTRRPEALQVVTAALAVAAAVLWLRFAELPRLLRVSLLGSYYVLYEYGIMCRGYTLGLVLVFAFCALYHPCRIRFVALAALLALLSATSLYGLLLALALGLFLFSHGPFVQPPGADDDRAHLALPADWLAGAGIFIAGVALTVVTTWPPVDAYWAPAQVAEVTSGVAVKALVGYWAALFPFAHLTTWDWLRPDHLGSRLPAAGWIIPALGAVWLAMCLGALRRAPRLVACYGIGALLIMAASHFVLGALPRHAGHQFILLIACTWLFARETRGRGDDRLLCTLVAASIGVQLFTGAAALDRDLRQPFSGAGEAAAFLRAHNLQDRPIVADDDHPLTAVAILLDRAFLFPRTGETAQTTVFHKRRATVDAATLVAQAGRLARQTGVPALILRNHDLGNPATPGLTVTPLSRGGPNIVEDESIFIYQVAPAEEPRRDP